jgi:hypothetical protein
MEQGTGAVTSWVPEQVCPGLRLLGNFQQGDWGLKHCADQVEGRGSPGGAGIPHQGQQCKGQIPRVENS